MDRNLHDEQRSAFLAAVRSVPGVVSATMSDHAPGIDDWQWRNPIATDNGKGPTIDIRGRTVDSDFFSTYGAKLRAGRFLNMSYSADRASPDLLTHVNMSEIINVMLGESAVSALGFPSPEAVIDQVFTVQDTKTVVRGLRIRVVGVLGDMRFSSSKDRIDPMVYYLSERPLAVIASIRFSGVAEPTMRQRLADLWRTIAPEVPFEAISAVNNLDRYYKPDRVRSNLFSIGAAFAALIGCFGLYGLAAFNTSRRAHEIGLRKVLGAPRGVVVRLLIGQFLRPVLIANLIAWPIAYWALSRWLSQFDDRIALSLLYFLGPSSVALLIALVTVAGLSFASANTQPSVTLRCQ